jgi:hypothetical protein
LIQIKACRFANDYLLSFGTDSSPVFLNVKAADRQPLFCVWFGSARIPAFAN